jgi:D-alanyl-D-alanine carboxypeptidase
MRVIAALAVLVLASACGGAKAHPELQQQLNALVASHVAPGVTAYVSGPHLTWSGAAGYANLASRQAMEPGARMRLESVTKLWTAVVVVKLAEEHKLSLDDTLGRWWPTLFTGDKATITIRELLNHTSGLIDNNDLTRSSDHWLAQTHDPQLRRDLLALAARLSRNPSAGFSDLIEIRWAAALPLLFAPSHGWHYSNIGYLIVGHIAERASGESLSELYRRVIVEPLHLTTAAYAPGGPIAGDHPVGYAMHGRRAVPATDVGAGALGPEGGIVSDAKDEATFLRAVVRGELVPTRDLLRPSTANSGYALGIGLASTCGTPIYQHNGGGTAWASSVAVSRDGSRVAVVLLNGRGGVQADAAYPGTALTLFCAA